ncbi:rho GTPase-activating protein 32-like [Sinocyclocheilus anshuiensis]|uniref:rho GTPase-activating protein 32-like n=1 Tax=Sinocyclocheilus anshuiensis TaxID=1608454 RepID=UPI0007BA5014|nr:PREDICTED: rho GTPase-activating protein 32-like [Sinocyclocheilus anshuiensis]XP_016356831.1 PREDICTED: rho GTPase-activating protein 32-like [Sinocyclocheilus anshuiensis]XP_016356832.1 PREDICTED: rho GTPase-activating protein 32-like [Sinocyclocheilus anshuiensis]XP_016356833.1 PREDICTED: rho GTPase-activating protein 32-like [Sinocyclocheilus anshuiensis]
MEACSGTAAATHGRVPTPLRDACSHDPCEGPHPEEDEGEEDRSLQSAETAGWEDAIAVMARGAPMVPELPAESSLRSCASTASMKVKNVKKLSLTKGHFPRLAECAHFHYEIVDFGSVQLSLSEDQNHLTHNGLDSKESVYLVQICCQGRKWIVRRSYEEFRVLDKHLHLCIYDRRFSQLPELPRIDSLKDKAETLSQMLTAYISRLSAIADNKINCGPALTWMEIDNKGNHLLVHDESSINVPAVAAAHVIKRYIAQAADELSFEVGDIVSVIDMPPKEDTGWWRGKHGFQVGFFPSECVELISEKIPSNVTNPLAKPVSKKHGKLITFLRTFMKSRPTKQKLKQRGILKERVFGCDLGEHLLNSGHDVPQVIRSCTEFIERHGVVDGIYRLSGISSNIQKLRHEFDSEHVPDLTKDNYVQDIHSVGSLCKLYFRELPNPLLTYQLYEKFSDAVPAATDEERLVKVHDVIQQLPPPHYRTLEFLMRHLSRMGTYSAVTNMHCKNLAIVWAPNLLRSKQIESACFSGTSAFLEVRVQSVVVEFILNHVDVLFSPKLSTLIRHSTGHTTLARPKSLLVSSPSTKLLSLEEAQARTQAQLISPVSPNSKYIDVGGGPAALQGKFHTVIDFPSERKKGSTKVKKSPVGNWFSFFNMGKSSATAKPKLHRHPSEPNEMKTTPLPGGRGDNGTLRSAKSEESLSSSHNVEGGSHIYRPRRPLSTSDALSISFNEELLDSRLTGDSRSSLKDHKKDTVSSSSCVPALISPPHPAADSEFIGIASLDIDPLAFQSTQLVDPTLSESKKRGSRKKVGGSHTESKNSDKVTSPSQPPDLIPLRSEEVPVTSSNLELGTSKTGHESTAKSSVVKSSTVSCPSDIMSLVKKPNVSTKGGEGHQRSASFCKAESRSADVREHRRADSGAVTFECTPGLVRSVSLITPQPAVKSAARMLALALAESAQRATRLSKRWSSEPPTPVSPVHHQNPLFTLQFPPPLQTSDREERYVSSRTFPDPSSTMSTESHTDAGSLRSTCACHGSESGLSFSDGCDAPAGGQCTHVPCQDFSPHRGPEIQRAPESQTTMRDNIRHVGVGTDGGGSSLDEEMEVHGSLQPTPSERFSSLDSHSAIEALHNKQAANAANFRAILAETSMPASVHEVRPQASSTPPSVVYQYKPKDQRSAYSQQWSSPVGQSTPYYQPDDGRPHPRVLSRNYCNTLAPRSLHQSIKYKGQREDYSSVGLHKHRGPRYPPLDGASVYPTIRRVRSMHTPPEDKFFFLQRQGSQSKAYQKPPPSDIQQVRPYFEDGKVQYRYSPYSEARYNQHRENSHGYTLSYTLSKLPSRSSKVMGSTENYHKPLYNLPVNIESDFMTRDVGLQPRMKNPSLYEAFNSALSDRHFSQSIKQENAAKERLLGPVVSQPHLVRGDRQCQETMHTRSRSNSGKEMLISTEGADGKYRVTMVSHYSPEHPLSEPGIPVPSKSDGHGSGQGARSALKMKQSRSMHNYPQHRLESMALPRNLTLHKEYSCPDFKHTRSSDSFGVANRNQDRLMYKTLSNSKEDYQYIRTISRDPQRSKRSQSVKTRHQAGQAKMTLERDHRLSSSSQSRTRTHSMFVPSRSDYSESYVSIHPKAPKTSRASSGVFPNYGCMPLHSNRLYSTAVGHTGFHQTELRPEMQIYAE